MSAEWQQIETAPQDGRRIIVGRFVGCALDWIHIAWRKANVDPGTSWRMRGGCCDPTHWIDVPVRRELPANPAEVMRGSTEGRASDG